MDKGPDEVDKVWGHIGERTEDGEWSRFEFEVLDATGDQHTVEIGEKDLPEGWDWEMLFDWLEDYAEDQDIDYDNPYGEK